MNRKTLTAKVTDTNHAARGAMTISVDFDEAGPSTVQHEGRTYYSTGKTGSNTASGQPVREMATDRDARLWITFDAREIWED